MAASLLVVLVALAGRPADGAARVSMAVPACRGGADGAIAEPGPHGTRHTVSGRVFTHPRNWCGGAAPPLDYQPPPPQPTPRKRLLVRKGDRNSATAPEVRVVTDQHGAFRLELPAGRYCVVEEPKAEWHEPEPPPRYVDVQCLRGEWEACDATWDVTTRDLEHADVNLHETCFGPCYRGPRPP